jgi:hypothetical protein
MEKSITPEINSIFQELNLPFAPQDVEKEDGVFYRFSLLIIIELLKK